MPSQQYIDLLDSTAQNWMFEIFEQSSDSEVRHMMTEIWRDLQCYWSHRHRGAEARLFIETDLEHLAMTALLLVARAKGETVSTLTQLMADLHRRKNAGYAGHSDDPWINFRCCEAFGIDACNGVITRLSDKWSRLQSLWCDPNNEQVGEAVEDTLLDFAAYSLILICLLREADEVPR
jgi:hypothetical protein